MRGIVSFFMHLDLPKNDAVFAAHLRWLMVRLSPKWRQADYGERADVRERAVQHRLFVANEADLRGGHCSYDLDPALVAFAKRFLVRRAVMLYLVVFLLVGIPVGLFFSICALDILGYVPAQHFNWWITGKGHLSIFAGVFLKVALPINLIPTLIVGYFAGLRGAFRIIRHASRATTDPNYLVPKLRRF
jgi:hypothetical protein